VSLILPPENIEKTPVTGSQKDTEPFIRPSRRQSPIYGFKKEK
jgi:hypothetical protein